MEEQWKHPKRALLKVRLTIFIGHCLAEWSFSMQLCSRICWVEDNRIDSIDRRKSTENERDDVTLWKFNENTQYFLLHCYTASISMLFNNCWSFERRMAKISSIRSVLRCTTASTMTEQSLYLSTAKAPSRCQLQEVYLWSPTSGDNIQVWIRRPDDVTVELWAAGGHCPPGGRFW